MSKLNYLSICSGIDAVSVAWKPLGWKCEGVSEIDEFRSAVLNYHYPNVKNFGDFTEIQKDDFKRPVSLIVGGTPCASFSIAGLRRGFDDDRGNLALEFIKLVDRIKPQWVLWENVPGVLSSNKGRDFGSFLGGLAECGYGFAYRVLDAQYIRTQRHNRAVPQRRRRVFVVGYFGSWRNPAKVLFDREALSGYPAPSRTKQQKTTEKPTHRIVRSDKYVQDNVASTIAGRDYKSPTDLITDPTVVCFEKRSPDGGNRQPCVYVKFKDVEPFNETGLIHCADEIDTVMVRKHEVDIPKLKALLQKHKKPVKQLCKDLNVNYTLAEHWFRKGKSFSIPPQDIWIKLKDYLEIKTDEFDKPIMEFEEREGVFESAKRVYNSKGAYPTITASQTLPKVFVERNAIIRRLTPLECERLQGFPDNYTQIPYKGKPKEECPVAKRYEACGRSMAINVMEWLGTRIQMVQDKIDNE